MAISIRVQSPVGEFSRAVNGISEPIASAATGAMRDAAEIIKRDARAEMRGAGMSSRFTNAFRTDAYPKGGKQSINAAAHAFHKIRYAGVFEEGATVHGKPMLWLPITRNLPEKISPRKFIQRGGTLVSMKSKSGLPLLGAPIGDDGRLVPVYVGKLAVTIGKKFSVAGVMARTADKIESLYAQNLKVD